MRPNNACIWWRISSIVQQTATYQIFGENEGLTVLISIVSYVVVPRTYLIKLLTLLKQLLTLGSILLPPKAAISPSWRGIYKKDDERQADAGVLKTGTVMLSARELDTSTAEVLLFLLMRCQSITMTLPSPNIFSGFPNSLKVYIHTPGWGGALVVQTRGRSHQGPPRLLLLRNHAS